MNINMNLVCEHHELELLVVREQHQFHKKSSGTLGWKFMNFMNITFVIQEHSCIVHEHI